MRTGMNLLVCGSRDWSDRLIFGIVMRGFLDRFPELQIVEGCARGADQMAEEFASQFGLECRHFPAKWEAYPRSERWRAGHDRNRQMLDEGQPDMVVAFKDGLDPSLKKGGTENMIRISKEAGLSVMLVGSGSGVRQS
jgi:hypothetical protein